MLLLSSLALGATLFVGPNQPYPTITDALAGASPGDVVAIDPGTYEENLVVDVPVTLRGSGRGSTLLRGTGSGDAVVRLDTDVRIEHLSIDGNGDPGVRQWLSSVLRVELVDVEIYGADTLGGSHQAGAVDVSRAELLIRECYIHDTVSEIGAVSSEGALLVFDSTFEDNHQVGSYGAGAILAWPRDARVRIERNLFVDNTSETHGGAVGLISDRWALPADRVVGNVFARNTSDEHGGALHVSADVSFTQDFFVRVDDNLFVANQAARGGAVAVEGTDYIYAGYGPGTAYVQLRRSTFVDNRSTGSGAHVWGGPHSAVRSLNLLLAYGDGPEGYYDEGDGSQDHLLLWANSGADGAGAAWSPGPTVLLANPEFHAFSDDGDPSNDDLRLRSTSPAIDAGSPALPRDPDGSRSDIGRRR